MRHLLSHLRTLAIGLTVGAVSAAAAVVVLLALVRPRPADARPDPAALVERVREVARLESLDVAVYKRVELEPDPPAASTTLGQVANWATWSIDPPRGRAIVFADAHLGLDVSKIDVRSMRADGDAIDMRLPPVTVQVEIRPGETEVAHSNLDSAQTADLLDKAKWEIEADVARDPALAARARASAERALRTLFEAAGFRTVRFTDAGAASSPTS